MTIKIINLIKGYPFFKPMQKKKRKKVPIFLQKNYIADII
jgi:hypothetical protein